MPRGQPDFGMYASSVVGAANADVAEAAVRLGSIVSYDRKGNVVWLDDFEGPALVWDKRGEGAAGLVALSSAYVLSGSQSVIMLTNPVADSYVQLRKYFTVTAVLRQGIEFAIKSDVVDCYVLLQFYVQSGGNLQRNQIKLDFANGDLYYRDSGFGLVKFGTMDLPGVAHTAFVHIKLAADFEAETYIKFMYGDTEFDLSTIAANRTSPGGESKVEASLSIYTNVNVAKTMYVDDFILTQNEP